MFSPTVRSTLPPAASPRWQLGQAAHTAPARFMSAPPEVVSGGPGTALQEAHDGNSYPGTSLQMQLVRLPLTPMTRLVKRSTSEQASRISQSTPKPEWGFTNPQTAAKRGLCFPAASRLHRISVAVL